MPRKHLMSWEAKQTRWVKMYHGVRHRVTCEDLKLPRDHWTQETSYKAANEWWTKRRAEIDGRQNELPEGHPHEQEATRLKRQLSYTTRHGLEREAVAIRHRIEAVKTADPAEGPGLDKIILDKIEAARLLGVNVPYDLDPSVLRALFGQGELWADRYGRDTGPTTGRTLAEQAAKYIGERSEEARAGLRSADGAELLRTRIIYFQTFVGPDRPVDAITTELWQKWYVHCAGKSAERDADPQGKAGWSAAYAKATYRFVRAFVKDLYVRGVLHDLPRNLNDPKHKFLSEDKDIPTFNLKVVRKLLQAAQRQHKLHLLLMLNTGCTQKDISDLKPCQVNRKGTAIGRRRSKTRKQKGAVRVVYPLWEITQDELAKWRTTEGDRLLLTFRGKRWVHKRIGDDGKLKKSDSIATEFNKTRKRAGITGPGKSLKVFRKTSASLIGNNPKFSDLADYFLGHKGKSMANKHYVKRDAKRLRAAVRWLGRKYGLVETPAPATV